MKKLILLFLFLNLLPIVRAQEEDNIIQIDNAWGDDDTEEKPVIDIDNGKKTSNNSTNVKEGSGSFYLKKYIDAIGGEDRILRAQQMRVVQDFETKMNMGGQDYTTNVSIDITYKSPMEIKTVTKVPGMTTQILNVNGKNYSYSFDSGWSYESETEMPRPKWGSSVIEEYNLLGSGLEINYGGTQVLVGTKNYVVNIPNYQTTVADLGANGKTVTHMNLIYYINSETYLVTVRQMETVVDTYDASGNITSSAESLLSLGYSDWREVDGILCPHYYAGSMKTDAPTGEYEVDMTAKVSTLTFNPYINPSDFKVD